MTIKDIAKESGYSVSTVSRVLNNRRDVSPEAKKKIDEITSSIHDLAGEEFNVSSPRQLGVILFEKLKLPCAKKTRSGYSTDSKVLEKIVTDHPIVPLIIEYRNLTKLYSTYVEGLTN